MTKSLNIPGVRNQERFTWENWKKYLLLAVFCNLALWGAAFVYQKTKEPTYTSDWTATLPGLQSSTAVQLPNIAQTSTQVQSPFNNYFDPRETYKYIALSEMVLSSAAEQLDLSLEEFGKPDIKILDNTTLINFKIDGETAEQAKNKAIAFSQAFERRLQELRAQEQELQSAPLKAELATAKQKLHEAQQKLSRYKTLSGFSSSEQIGQLSSNIEELRRERAVILAQTQEVETNFQGLSAALKLSTQQATEAFTLQSDPHFQQLLNNYGEASTTLVSLNSRYTPNNPAVIEEQARVDSLQTSLVSRAESLLNKSVSLDYIETLSVDNSQPRQALTQELVSTQIEKQGLGSRSQEIEQQITALENKLKRLAEHEIVVRDLEREVKIAEATFSSTITKLNTDKSHPFGSYPSVQLIAAPSLPTGPAWPNKKLILIGTMAASVFVTTGFFFLGRQEYLSSSSSRKVSPSYAVYY